MRSIHLAILVCAAAATSARAQDAGPTLGRLTPDRTFGRGGTIRSIVAGGESLDRIDRVAVDASGRVVVAGITLVAGSPRFGTDAYAIRVARFLPSGALDTSFAGDGMATLAVQSRFVFGLAIDGLGGITVSGVFHAPGETYSTGPRTIAARLTGDGAADTGFSDDGLLEVPALLGDDASAHEAQAGPVDGSVVLRVSGRTGNLERRGLMRVSADGTVDTSFGSGGLAELGETYGDFAIDADGGVILARRSLFVDQAQDARVLRLLPSGVQDLAFGTLGVLNGPDGAIRGEAVEIDSAGRIVVLGREERGGRAVYRFSAVGVLDAGFAAAGRAPLALGIPGDARSLDIQFAAARGADGFALLSQVWFMRPGVGHPVADGFSVQSFDPAAPAAVSSYVSKVPHAIFPNVNMTGVAVSADGAAAFAVGYTELTRFDIRPILLRVDLTRAAPRPLPNLSVEWIGVPVTETQLGRSVSGSLRVRNAGPGAVTNAVVEVYVSDDDVWDATDSLALTIATGSVRGGGARTRRLTIADLDAPGALAGKRLIAVVNPLGTLPELESADNVGVSAPIE